MVVIYANRVIETNLEWANHLDAASGFGKFLHPDTRTPLAAEDGERESGGNLISEALGALGAPAARRHYCDIDLCQRIVEFFTLGASSCAFSLSGFASSGRPAFSSSLA